jgi:hypothetical protein
LAFFSFQEVVSGLCFLKKFYLAPFSQRERLSSRGIHRGISPVSGWVIQLVVCFSSGTGGEAPGEDMDYQWLMGSLKYPLFGLFPSSFEERAHIPASRKVYK